MKIGFFTDTYQPNIDGIVRSIDLYREALEKLGHEVYIFAPKVSFFTREQKDPANRIYRFNSVKSIIVPNYPLAIPFSFQHYYHFLKLKLDIIHSHTPFTLGALGNITGRIENKPVIMTYHTYYSEYIRHYFLKGKILTPKMTMRYCTFVTNQADIVISPSEKFQKVMRDEGVKKEIAVLPTGVKLEDFADVKKGYFRRRYFLGNKKILLFVGRLAHEKNVQFLLQMMMHLQRQRPDVVLAIVGDGIYKKDLIALTRSLKIQQQVVFTGWLRGKKLSYAYADADCFVFASKTDTQGLVLLEACAQGLPVVMLADNGLTNAVQEGKNGFVVGVEDPRIFSRKVYEVLADENRYRGFSDFSRHMAAQYSIDAQARQLVAIYEKALAAKLAAKKQPPDRGDWGGEF